jgi:hypothetical protein
MSGIGEHCLGGPDVALREFRRTACSAARAPRGGKARLGAFPDQAALEFRQRAKHEKQAELARSSCRGLRSGCENRCLFTRTLSSDSGGAFFLNIVEKHHRHRFRWLRRRFQAKPLL